MGRRGWETRRGGDGGAAGWKSEEPWRPERREIPSPPLPASLSPAHPFSVALFSGPEGGFSVREYETALRYDMIAVTLGPRTLRAETAPIVATAAILYEMGDLE